MLTEPTWIRGNLHSEPVVVRPVTSAFARERFVRLPWQVYAGDPCWVPPLLVERRQLLDPRRSPFFRHAEVQLFLARRGRRAVGRIATFVDHAYDQCQHDRLAFFGFFEVRDDAEAAAALLAVAENWARLRGARALRGPVNFWHDNELGLLLDAYDRPPVLMTSYNPPHYRSYIEGAGYAKALDWYAYALDRTALGVGAGREIPPVLEGALEAARAQCGAQFRTMRLRDLDAELVRAQRIYNHAWEHNPDFVPLDDAEVGFLAASLRWVIDPDLVVVAEVAGEAAGVAITLPDYNQVLRLLNGRLFPLGWVKLLRERRKIDTARVFALGVTPEHRHRGIDVVLYAETMRALLRKGYQRAELSLIAEHNAVMRHVVEGLGARVTKTYRVYEKPLTE
jgi:ribosomal protein S18 acetylase RimI-like enzyme